MSFKFIYFSQRKVLVFFISIYFSVEDAGEELWQNVRKFARKSQHHTRDITREFFYSS